VNFRLVEGVLRDKHGIRVGYLAIFVRDIFVSGRLKATQSSSVAVR
jgi:hypothetical protein